MRNWRSTVLGLLVFLSINNAYALGTILLNFTQLVRAVENADDVKAIIHFDRCLITNPTNESLQTQIRRRLDEATTRFNFTKFLHFKARIADQIRDTVTTSMKSFIEHPSGKLITLLGRLSVFEDNTAILHYDFYDLVDHKKLFEIDWLCDISNGRDDKGLVLYDFP